LILVKPIRSALEMKTQTIPNEVTLARLVAAEDLSCGDFVAVLNEIVEFPSFLWQCDSQTTPLDEPVRILWRSSDNGLPLRVKELCLPFVFVTRPVGRHLSLDIRQCQLVRLDRRYAKRVWKALSRAKKGKANKRRRKSSKK